jgi:membrane protease YdiL (CAAX protease family)
VDTLEPTSQTASPVPAEPLDLHPAPNDPPWNVWIALALWFLSVILILLAPAVLVLPYLASSGMLTKPQQELAQFAATDPTSILIQMAAIIPAHLFTFLFSWLIVTRRARFSITETLGFGSGGVKWWHYAALTVFFFSLAALVGTYYPDNENELTRVLKSSRGAVYVVAFMATFTAPLIEEVIYRGVLFSAFRRATGVAPAIAFVTIIFALVHLPQYYESPATLALLLLLSFGLTMMRAVSGNLLPCIIFHTIVNGIQSAALVFGPYFDKGGGSETIGIFFK